MTAEGLSRLPSLLLWSRPMAPADRPLLRVDSLQLRNYRGFESLDLELHPQVTVLFGENGAGKTNVLAALATLLAGLWQKAPRNIEPSDAYEPTVQPSLARQGRYPVSLSARVMLRGEAVAMGREVESLDSRTTNADVKAARAVFAKVLQGESEPWPLLAWYGTQRLHDRARDSQRKRPKPGRREDGWVDCLDPRSSEEQLLQWWFEASLPMLQGAPSPAHDALVRVLRAAVAQPQPDGSVDEIDAVALELPDGLPVFRFASGRVVRWEHLSDGYHIFLGLVGDLARRAWTLNAGVIADPIATVEGVVLIDELDLHLHPRWQMAVVEGLRRAFPRVQFVVTTHSPLVLASVHNDQVRRLSAGRLVARDALVHGRDPNSIYEDQGVPLRQPWARRHIAEIAELIDADKRDEALQMLRAMEEEWGTEDAALVRLRAWLG